MPNGASIWSGLRAATDLVNRAIMYDPLEDEEAVCDEVVASMEVDELREALSEKLRANKLLRRELERVQHENSSLAASSALVLPVQNGTHPPQVNEKPPVPVEDEMEKEPVSSITCEAGTQTGSAESEGDGGRDRFVGVTNIDIEDKAVIAAFAARFRLDPSSATSVESVVATVEGRLEDARTEIDTLRRQVADASRQANRLEKELSRARSTEDSSAEALRRELAEIKGRAERAEEQLASNESLCNKDEIESLKAALRSMKSQSDKLTADLTKIENILRPVVIASSDSKSPEGGVETLAHLAAEQLKDLKLRLREKDALLVRWDATYLEAKGVNDQLTVQLAAAEKDLRASMAKNADRDADIARVEAAAGERIATLEEDLRRVIEEGHAADREREQLQNNSQRAASIAAKAREETEALHETLAEREQELETARSAIEDLERVLKDSQASRASAVDRATNVLRSEAARLRQELAEARESQSIRRETSEAVLEGSSTDAVAAKDAIIAALQTKQLELRRLLQDAVARADNRSTVDKKLVSEFIFKYIRAGAHTAAFTFPGAGGAGADQSEAGVARSDDILRVFGSILDWGPEEMERAGLVEGPLNPFNNKNGNSAEGKSTKLKSIVRSLWGTPGSSRERADSKEPERRGLAETWVDFLISESEEKKTNQQEEDLAVTQV